MADPNALILKMSADISGMQKQISAAVGIVDSGSAKMVLRSKEAAAAIEKSFGTVTVDGFKTSLAEVAALQDRLRVAQAAGNAAEAKALRAELLLRAQVQKAAVAQLETQLAIARAAGSKGQVAQLTEALALQSQISKFQGVGLSGSRALHEAEAAVVALSAAERAAEGANVGKALDKVFDSSKLAIMEEGAAKIRVFGSALEPLGPVGIGVAAAIGAVAIAAEEARKAMEWADDLERTSNKLGVTTTALQQLDYASVATSIGLQQGRDALAEFNGMIGKFETHTGDARLVKWADAIKLTRAEVNQTVDPVQKLSLVMEKIAQLRDAQSRTAAAKAFGLDGLLPIINEGSDGIDKFIGKMKEAQANGSIVSPEQIARAAELNDKVEEFTYRIGVDFKKIFIELAPVVERVAEFIERCTSALAGFMGEIPDAIRGVQDLIDKLPHIPNGVNVSQDLKEAAGRAAVDVIPGGRQAHDIIDAGRQIFDGLVQRGKDRQNRFNDPDDPDAMAAEARAAAKNRQGPGQQLNFDTPHHAGSKADETLNFDKAAQDAYDSGLKALLSAQASLTTDILARADAEKAAIDADLTKKLHDLDVEEQKIRQAKNDKHKAEQLALIEKAKTEEQNAAAAKKELIDRRALSDLIAQEAQLRQQTLTNRTDAEQRDQAHLTALAGLADTLEERTALEREALAIAQQRERELAAARVAQAQAALAEAQATKDIAKIELARAQLSGAQAAQADLGRSQGDQAAAFDRGHENPIQTYLRSFQDLTTQMQTEGVKALDGIASGIADIVANGGKAGDVLRSLVRQLLYDFTKNLAQQAEAGILGKLGVKLPNAGGLPGATAAATGMTTAITTGGATAATEMGTAITTAGATVAAQLAAAMAAGGATGGGLGGLGGLSKLFDLSGSTGFNLSGFGSGAGVDFASALSGWGGGFSFFANGTDSAPGGMSIVGERGPELLNLPRGAQVIPNDILRGLSKPGGKAGDQVTHHWNVNIMPTSHMSAADNRRTGAQIAASLRREIGQSARRGFSGG